MIMIDISSLWKTVDDYLASFENSLTIEELHGLLSGLALSPSYLKPAQWLPLIFRSTKKLPEFDSKEEADQLFQLIFSLANQIHQQMQEGALRPLIGELDIEGEKVQDAQLWCNGFLIAAAFDPLFKQELQDPLIYQMMLPVFFLARPEKYEEILKGKNEREIRVIKKDYLNELPPMLAEVKNIFDQKYRNQPDNKETQE